MATTAAKPVRAYAGPACPYCTNPIGDWIRTGLVTCPKCDRYFEATYFQPPEPPAITRALEVVATGPEGAAACANHPRNAATTSCLRCGVFICSLCDMNLGTGSYCPSCFDRARAEEKLAPAVTRFRDYGAMARIVIVIGLFFSFMMLGLPFGAIGIYYARKAIKQRRENGDSTFWMWVLIVIALGEIASTLLLVGILLAARMGMSV